MTAPLAPDVPLDEIEWRIDGDIDQGGGVRVVCYLDAPTVSRLLDEWVGPWRWSDRYEPTGKEGSMWCHLSVADGDGVWVTKSDLGTASNFEADKGLVSDAFKRVAMRKWGVGRNVFDLPLLRLPEGKFRTYQSRGGTKPALTDVSLSWIAGELRRLGYEDAAKATESAAPPPDEPAEAPEQQAAQPAEVPFDAPTAEQVASVKEQWALLDTDAAESFQRWIRSNWNVDSLREVDSRGWQAVIEALVAHNEDAAGDTSEATSGEAAGDRVPF